jgi:hypothetical protein
MILDKSEIGFKTEEEIKALLAKEANPNCNTCYGRGYEGYTEDKKTKSKTFIRCHRKNCVNREENNVVMVPV